MNTFADINFINFKKNILFCDGKQISELRQWTNFDLQEKVAIQSEKHN